VLLLTLEEILADLPNVSDTGGRTCPRQYVPSYDRIRTPMRELSVAGVSIWTGCSIISCITFRADFVTGSCFAWSTVSIYQILEATIVWDCSTRRVVQRFPEASGHVSSIAWRSGSGWVQPADLG